MSAAAPLPSVLLLGGGKMGGAMLAGWRERGLAPSVVVDPAAPPLAGPGVQVVSTVAEVPAGFRPAAVVLAVKPQQAAAALPGLLALAPGAVVLSIMAGVTVARIGALLGAEGAPGAASGMAAAGVPASGVPVLETASGASVPGAAAPRVAASGAAVVRAMPNTPAAIGRGITVAFRGAGVDDGQAALCGALLASVGEVAWVEDEGLMDAVTAVSGSGPAYVFLLAELMERAGVEQGLPPALARQLARATVAGSGALLAASPEEAAALRVAVTSPGGTTQAALGVLMADGAWPALVPRAIEAAARRSRELAG